MADPVLVNRLIPVIWRATLLLAVVSLASCSPAWVRMGDNCVRDDGERPVARTVNKTDPELCDRPVKQRSPHYLRVPPPEKTD